MRSVIKWRPSSARVAKRNGLQVVIDKGKGGPAIFGD